MFPLTSQREHFSRVVEIMFTNTLRLNDDTLRLSFPTHMNTLNGYQVEEYKSTLPLTFLQRNSCSI